LILKHGTFDSINISKHLIKITCIMYLSYPAYKAFLVCIGITLSICPSVQMACKRNSSLTFYEPILMKDPSP